MTQPTNRWADQLAVRIVRGGGESMWLDRKTRIRGTYIGGRDATAIMGANPYASPLDVYASIVVGRTVQENAAMWRGTAMEPAIAEWIGKQRGVPVNDDVRDVFYRDDEHPHFRCSVDMVEGDPLAPHLIHEIKTTTSRSADKWGTPGTDEAEESAVVQAQWEMMITGASDALIWCFIVDGSKWPLEYRVARDDAFIATMRERCQQFWADHILPESPPPPSEGTSAETIALLAPVGDEDKRIMLGQREIDAAVRYVRARDEESAAKAIKREAGDYLKLALGSAVQGTWEAGSVTYRGGEEARETNWENVAWEVANESGLDGRRFQEIVAANTAKFTKPRTLRVSMTKRRTK